MPEYLESFQPTEKGEKDLLGRLEAWADQCYSLKAPGKAPLVDAELDLKERYDHSSRKIKDPSVQWPPVARPRVEGLKYRDSSFQNETRERVRLVRSVRTGRYRGSSQVYAARFLPEAEGDVEIIVKLYQGSYNSSVARHRKNPYMSPSDIKKNLTLFDNEAETYQKLAHLQGSIVPHVHGFFLVDLPHGEKAVALVMEFIRGTAFLPEVFNKFDEPLRFSKVIEKLLAAAGHILQADVVPQDIDAEHVIWPFPSSAEADSPGLPVFFDFSRFCDPGQVRMRQNRVVWLLLLQGSYGFSIPEIQEWVEEVTIPKQPELLWFAINNETDLKSISELTMKALPDNTISIPAGKTPFRDIPVEQSHRDSKAHIFKPPVEDGLTARLHRIVSYILP